jgi:hypothetical protein
MPSLLHEGLLDLIRERPELVAQLLRQLLHVDVPSFTEARLADTTLTKGLRLGIVELLELRGLVVSEAPSVQPVDELLGHQH